MQNGRHIAQTFSNTWKLMFFLPKFDWTLFRRIRLTTSQNSLRNGLALFKRQDSISTIVDKGHWRIYASPTNVIIMYPVNDIRCYKSFSRMKQLWISLRPDYPRTSMYRSWWRHQMETFSALLALCEGNSPVTGGFPSQRPVTRSSDVLWSAPEQTVEQTVETPMILYPSRSLWRHCIVKCFVIVDIMACCLFGVSVKPLSEHMVNTIIETPTEWSFI